MQQYEAKSNDIPHHRQQFTEKGFPLQVLFNTNILNDLSDTRVFAEKQLCLNTATITTNLTDNKNSDRKKREYL